MQKELSQLKTDRGRIASKLRRAISDNKDTTSLKKSFRLVSMQIENYKRKHKLVCETNHTEIKEKISKLLKKDSFKVTEHDSDMHEFTFACSNSGGRPQQLKSDTLYQILRLCKRNNLDFVVNSKDKESLIIYFW